MKSVAQTLVEWLKSLDVDTVFGIPGVHTIELYRALAGSGIRHVTARHEAGAGFMADGYARVSGRFGVALVITGPGVTNALTPMAQARADSVPILVISGVNHRESLGKGLGFLHELPDQRAMARVLGPSLHLEDPRSLPGVLAQAGRALTTGRGGPVHVQIPLDLMATPAPAPAPLASTGSNLPDAAKAQARLRTAKRPVILAGGGCRQAESQLQALAENLGAPVVLTTNARGLLHAHPLAIPASASLAPVRALIEEADVVLAVGTELGQTDYDIYATGKPVEPKVMIRIDIDGAQLARHRAELTLQGDARDLLPKLHIPRPTEDGEQRAATVRDAARAALPAGYEAEVGLLEALRDAVPGSIMIGDSTQIAYAGNFYYDHDRPGAWFNAATGFGALGYATGAAVGAALADRSSRVLCLIGDGGLMFQPGELATAVDENLNITFIIMNNAGFGEIASAMKDAGTEVIGCTPTPPEFEHLARAFNLPFERCRYRDLPEAVRAHRHGPRMIEVRLDPVQT